MKKLLTWVTLFLAIASCREIQEKDIANTTVELISPKDEYHSAVLSQTFYWNKVDGASGYRIQIATPSFDPDTMLLVLDSTTTKTQFTKSLPYGKTYQWRVMAINGGYDSKFTMPRTLIIDSSANIAIQFVDRRSPKEDIYINKDKLTVDFAWNKLSQAVSYYFTIDSSGNDKFGPQKVLNTSYSYPFKNEGVYSWDVVGYDNINYSSKNSNKIYVKVDLTLPKCDLTYPNDKASVITTDSTLKWTSSDSPSFSGIKTHYVYVYTNAANTIVYKDYNGKSNTLNIEKIDFTLAKDTLWWFVTAEDLAGNTTKSAVRRIAIPK
jgi:hypothetical protein